MLFNKHFTQTFLRPPCAFFSVPAKKRLPTVISLKLCRTILIRLFVVLVIISSFLNTPAYTQESEDSQIFISGFNAYQQKDYTTTITKMNEVLQKYPDSPLRDMVLFWLSRAYYKSGNQQDAARYMSQFSKEYPDNPLKGTVDEELLALTVRYEKGEQLPTGSQPVVAQNAAPEKERLNVARVEQENLARQKSEQERLVAVQREQERIATVKGEEARAVAEKSALAKRAAAEAEQARLAAIQKEQERAATFKMEADRKALEKAEQERLAALKAEEDRQLSAKAEQQKAESEKVDMELVARQQAEMVRLTMAKAEQKRLAAQKAEEEREASAKADKAKQNRIASATAEEQHRAAAVEEKRLAALKAEEESLSAEIDERLRQDREKVEQQQRAAVAGDAAQRAAAQKEQERIAALRSEKERQAASAAEASRQAAAKQEQAQLAGVIAGQNPQRDATKNARASKTVLREKAIAQYKIIIEKYPKSKAAATAAVKLKELGVAVALPQAVAAEPLSENAQVMRFEVAPFAGLEFNLSAKPQAYPVSQRIAIPFEVTNRGNGDDSFYLESGFPAEYAAAFAAVSQPEQAVNQTTTLAPGEVFKGVITLVIPPDSIDGLRISYPVKAASRLLSEATQSREVTLTAAAPLLRAVVKTDKVQLAPGEKAVYRVSVLNVGSTAAEGVVLRLNFPPQLEPVDYAAAGFKQEMKSALVLDGVQIKSGESKEFRLTFQLRDDSLAGQELLVRAELVNTPLKTVAVFVSNAAYVQQQFGVQIQSVSGRQVVIPGQLLFVPFVVSNTGNVREKFMITAAVKGAQDAVIFQDLNRDGVRQPNEPIVTEVGPLAPKEEAGIVMEIQTPRNATDGSQGSAQIDVSSEGNASRSSSGTVQFVYSRPVLQMVMTAPEGRLKPGQVASFDLTITNRGSNLARVVELQGTWPDQLELIAAEPAVSSASTGSILWKFKELGAGEKRTIKVSFRVKSGIGVGTNIQVKNLLSYEDQLGNRY
jgi:outer membrane protein assembly factor BamD (BamD/ComL family)